MGPNSERLRDCFTFVLPVNFEMLDGSVITIETEEDWILIREWYKANPDVKERPTIEFPVEVLWADGTEYTVNSEEELKELHIKCKEENIEGPKHACFKLVHPVTWIMPDGTEIEIGEKEDWENIKTGMKIIRIL